MIRTRWALAAADSAPSPGTQTTPHSDTSDPLVSLGEVQGQWALACQGMRQELEDHRAKIKEP